MFVELEHLKGALKDYIEANYHISHPTLVDLRRTVLNEPGTISQQAFIESTPLYRGTRKFSEIGIPDPVRNLLAWLGSPAGGQLLFDPPYPHQAEALEIVAGEGAKCLLATTGTGSGKTETFLLPILSKLAEEAATNPGTFGTRAVRAVILYPMNALVNDQLGRLRALFGADPVRRWFTERAGRPMKFARYTGRSLYPGMRTEKRNKTRLKSLNFYRDLETSAQTDENSDALIKELRRRGRWPAKPSATDHESGMTAWLGSSRRWLDAQGRFQRAVERPEDAELLLRHEVQDAPPDLLITNYSMLEYMLLRPIERTIFERSRAFFADNPDRTLLFVLDEAHLYRGAGGTEVALLIRRLRNRLGLAPERLQVIATSASFSDKKKARRFVSGLVGRAERDIEVLTGHKYAQERSGPGDAALAQALAACRPELLRDVRPETRFRAIEPLLALRKEALRPNVLAIETPAAGQVTVAAIGEDFQVASETFGLGRGDRAESKGRYLLAIGLAAPEGAGVGRPGFAPDLLIESGKPQVKTDALQRLVYAALRELPVVGRLVNLCSGAHEPSDPATAESRAPLPIERIGDELFPSSLGPELRAKAADALLELASYAKPKPDGAPLLAARVHTLFRGLPGLWACADENCSELPADMRPAPTGRLYVQPNRTCRCGSRVFALHTCRDCGVGYFEAFARNPSQPDYLWSEDVGDIEDVEGVIRPVHLLLEDPGSGASNCVQDYLDPRTGRIGSCSTGARPVWLPQPAKDVEPGRFAKCPHCEARGSQTMDHQTKGDEPFQELVSVQLLDQPARPESISPLKGRKALIFSDGRQAASRLSGKLKDFSLRDSIRPLLLAGFRLLEARFGQSVALGNAYPAILFACAHYSVNFRLPGTDHREFAEDLRRVQSFLRDDGNFAEFCELAATLNKTHVRSVRAPLAQILANPHTGFMPLALAAPQPLLTENQRKRLHTLAVPPGDGPEAERHEALLELWCTLALDASAVLIEGTPTDWIDATEGPKFSRTNGRFTGVLEHLFAQKWHRAQFGSAANMDGSWIGFLTDALAQNANAHGFFVHAAKLRLRPEDEVVWRRCTRCTRAQPWNALLKAQCMHCEGQTSALDPRSDTVFRTRKLQYRKLVERLEAAGSEGYAPHPFVAEEHTAQLNDAGQDQVFSRAEWYELRFQDLDVIGPRGEKAGSVDVLSCTTTMEVGIDIGSLTAVALRNVPPGRANYQQRAGRAGRRGSSLSTVLTFAGADSHDQRFFSDPAAMVGGPMPDPVLNLDNIDIVERHAFALALSLFQQERIGMPPEDGGGSTNIFEALGTLPEFRQSDPKGFTFVGLKNWLAENRNRVEEALRDVIPSQAVQGDPDGFFATLPEKLLTKLETVGAATEVEVVSANPAIAADEGPTFDFGDDEFVADADQFARGVEEDENAPGRAHEVAETNEEAPLKPESLLDRLFAKAVLPRYAFPTDVVSFNVFDRSSSRYRAELLYSPQAGLTQALSQYAPGREVWVDGQKFRSMAIWSPFAKDRINAYRKHRLYYECGRCGYAKLEDYDGKHHRRDTEDCPACGKRAGMGPAERWLVPVGFAHPWDEPGELAADESPPTTRPTRAKLSAPAFKTEHRLGELSHQNSAGFTAWASKEKLVVTNLGVRQEGKSDTGFYYCTACGRTEPTGWPEGQLQSGSPHRRPYPNHGNQPEKCNGAVRPVVLGHEFLTDVALFSFRLSPELHLPAGSTAGRVVLTTVAEALSTAATKMLDIDASDIGGGYRNALNAGGAQGREVEVFLYDTAAGGAGFVRNAARDPAALLVEALGMLANCPTGCSSSCYSCLRSHKNRWDHGDLDRHLGASFLRHILFGERPFIPEEVEDRLLKTLQIDLEDSDCPSELKANGTLILPTLGDRSIVISQPLMVGRPGSARAAGRAPSSRDRFIDQLLVERALPAAVLRAKEANTEAPKASELPFALAEAGIPVYRSLGELADWPGKGLPPASAYAELPDAPAGSYVVQLDVHTMENVKQGEAKPFLHGSWHLFLPPSEQMRKPMLVRRIDGNAFQATGMPVTLAIIKPVLQGRVRLTYASPRPTCRPEEVNASVVETIGMHIKALGT